MQEVTQTCLFSGAILGDDTRDEHTIPASIGGRIKSKHVSSNEFNNACGSTVDQPLSKAFALFMHKLSPALPKDVQPGDLDVTVPSSTAKYALHRGHVIGKGVNCLARHANGRPHMIEGEIGALNKYLKGLQKKGLYQGELDIEKGGLLVKTTPLQSITSAEDAFCWEIEVSILKSALLTFDCLIGKSELRFTRSDSLSSIRGLIYKAVRERQMDDELKHHMWGTNYELNDQVNEFRRFGHAEESPFEHILIVSGNAARRTIELVWSLFGFEPHGFRLTHAWKGEDFNFIATNGILKNTTFRIDNFASPFRLGMRSPIRPFTSIPPGNAMNEMMRYVITRRMDAVREAIQYVEMNEDEAVTSMLKANANYIAEKQQSASMIIVVEDRLKMLYTGSLQDPDNIKTFSNCIRDTFNDLPAEELSSVFSPELDASGNIDWDFWVTVYRKGLRSLDGALGLLNPVIDSGVRPLEDSKQE